MSANIQDAESNSSSDLLSQSTLAFILAKSRTCASVVARYETQNLHRLIVLTLCAALLGL
jgi:hypothetical protein